MAKMKVLVGERFGSLVVTDRLPPRRYENGKINSLFRMRCDCGNEIVSLGISLRQGKKISCNAPGCVFSRRKFHGKSSTPEYNTWGLMIQRCYNPKTPHYAYYGGRGITVCDRWRSEFMNFFEDMGARPSDSHTLDRDDANGPYSKENCAWATKAMQSSNRRKVNEMSRRIAELEAMLAANALV